MNQRITGYHKDAEDHWVAELECGHGHHVRHDPPWMERDWVTTAAGRAGRLGVELNCVRCDEMGAKVANALLDQCKRSLTDAYESSGISGLCAEGRWEAALGSLAMLDVPAIVRSALTSKTE